MAKFAGLVGYVTEEETSPGVWKQVETPKRMKGDILRQASNTQNGDKINSNVTLSHRVSLVGDAYSFGNYYNIKWIDVDGRKWKVEAIEVRRPRIIVSLGGPWNG
jgi:hypothetical protein